MSTAKFHGATESELRSVTVPNHLIGLVDQRRRFFHKGLLRLESERLVLEGWREIPKSDVVAVRRTYTDAYTRFQAGGTRGGFPSTGFIGHFGKPLIIDTRDDDGPVYLLVDYARFLGSTRNKTWEATLRDWLSP